MNLNPYLTQDKSVVSVVLTTAKEMLFFERAMHTHSEYTSELQQYLEDTCPKDCRSCYSTYETNEGKVIAKVHCYLHTTVGEAIYKWLKDSTLYYNYIGSDASSEIALFDKD